ncbi:MAG: hypothetical protein ACK56I_23690, partial [bacterium]
MGVAVPERRLCGLRELTLHDMHDLRDDGYLSTNAVFQQLELTITIIAAELIVEYLALQMKGPVRIQYK